MRLAVMTEHAKEAYGPLGAALCATWAQFNRAYFWNALKPIPLILTQAHPYGRGGGACMTTPAPGGRAIVLSLSKDGERYVADNGALLHAMIHQWLADMGEDASHAGEPWRREIMRLHLQIAGKKIWAGRSKAMRAPVEEGGGVYRGNEDGPKGERSITQAEIAAWPPPDVRRKLGKVEV